MNSYRGECVRTDEEAVVVARVEAHLQDEKIPEPVTVRPSALNAVRVVVDHCEGEWRIGSGE